MGKNKGGGDKGDKKAAGGKGKGGGKEEKKEVKGAQAINVRHILVRQLSLASRSVCPACPRIRR